MQNRGPHLSHRSVPFIGYRGRADLPDEPVGEAIKWASYTDDLLRVP